MKLNSRLLISELCAAGAAALCTAVLVVGCATGERTGRFWNPGDVSSSDAYAQGELARDHAFAANANPTDGAPPKVATASGTQDGPNGRVSIPDSADSADSPPPPLTPPESPTTTTLSPADRAAAKAGRATGAAQATGAAAGSAELTGTDIPGTVVAPYVQKVSPRGAVDNSRHDSKIVKPWHVFTRPLDPFAATDAEPFPTPSNVGTPPATALPPTSPFPTLGATSARLSSADVPPPVPTGAALPAAEIPPPPVVSTKAAAAQAASAPPPVSATAAQPVASASASPAPAEEFDPTLASQPAPLPAATPEPAASESPPASTAAEGPVAEAAATVGPLPMALDDPSEATVVVPMRPHPGVKPGDGSLNADVAATQAAARPVVEPAGSQVMPPAQASAPANSYEAESHAQANGRPCVTPPSASALPPASATAPPKPTPATDAWESTEASKPADPPSGNSIPTPLAAPREQSANEPATMTVVSDPMICDSGSIHGRYTGDESLPSGSVPRPLDDGDSHKAHAVHPPASAGQPAAKSSDRSTDGKTTLFWDDSWSAPAGKHTVATADFSVPAPPPPETDDSPSGDLHASAAGAGSPLALATTGGASASPASRAWFVIGLVAGLAVSAVVWRRWRQSDEPEAG